MNICFDIVVYGPIGELPKNMVRYYHTEFPSEPTLSAASHVHASSVRPVEVAARHDNKDLRTSIRT
jgi:hypothetical protein